MRATLYRGDCLDVLASMEPGSVDAIVCDPPYGLGFMGKAWDALPPGEDWARACLRVLKPGGHLVAFGGTRTVHRLACAIEDAGFEIRDMIAWVQWQGFPKSLAVGAAIDRAAGAERPSTGLPQATGMDRWNAYRHRQYTNTQTERTAPATEDARTWEGFGTALKPAHEPAILARKPLAGTVAANVLEHGTGALNIDGTRYAYGDPAWPGPSDEWNDNRETGPKSSGSVPWASGTKDAHDLGRWPANLYACPKPSRAEREAGCERLQGRTGAEATERTEGTAGLESPRAGAGRTADRVKNHHPTVKPLGVMRWLCRLVGGQRGSVILDPFMGSGTTGAAAMLEGFDFIGIEREPEYMQIAEARVKHHLGALFAHGVQVIETEGGRDDG
jgi:site-specific DNA-methyltransferase (adenine-specific)